MRAIILGAGNSSRFFGAAPATRPKWTTELAGQSLAQHSVNVLHACGVTEVVMMRGALGGRINTPSVLYLDAPGTHNMVETLFRARTHFTSDFIVSYGDIIFEPRVLQALLDSPAEISVVVDRSWRDFFSLRDEDGVQDAESCRIECGRLVSIGQRLGVGELPEAQYIGLLRLQGKAVEQLCTVYDELNAVFASKPWRNARLFEYAFFTDLLQELIDRGIMVAAVPVDAGWLEFDRPRDLEIAQLLVRGEGRRSLFDFSAMPPFPSVLSAGGLATRRRDGDLEVLLVGSGKEKEWRIPKGMLEPGENVEKAACREVAEETGVQVAIDSFVGDLAWTYSYGGRQWSERCYFHLMSATSQADPVSDREHARAAWLPAAQALRSMMFDNERDILARTLSRRRLRDDK